MALQGRQRSRESRHRQAERRERFAHRLRVHSVLGRILQEQELADGGFARVRPIHHTQHSSQGTPSSRSSPQGRGREVASSTHCGHSGRTAASETVRLARTFPLADVPHSEGRRKRHHGPFLCRPIQPQLPVAVQAEFEACRARQMAFGAKETTLGSNVFL